MRIATAASYESTAPARRRSGLGQAEPVQGQRLAVAVAERAEDRERLLGELERLVEPPVRAECGGLLVQPQGVAAAGRGRRRRPLRGEVALQRLAASLGSGHGCTAGGERTARAFRGEPAGGGRPRQHRRLLLRPVDPVEPRLERGDEHAPLERYGRDQEQEAEHADDEQRAEAERDEQRAPQDADRRERGQSSFVPRQVSHPSVFAATRRRSSADYDVATSEESRW